jgi:hypothetical protein
MLPLRSPVVRHMIARGSAINARSRAFHSSLRAAVQIGDAIPDVELMEGSPGNKVNLFNELKGKGVIIGVPAAYCTDLLLTSITCTSSTTRG